MLLVALTGGIGSGKSLAGQYFSQLGAIVVDADQLARDVIERGTTGFDEVLLAFGDEILSNGEIDRKKLAAIIFQDPSQRSVLEHIIHPQVRLALDKIIVQAPSDGIVIYQIPILVESGGKERFDFIITVKTSEQSRKVRLKVRGLSEEDIDRRISAQVGDAEREDIADYVLHNDGDPEHLLRQVEELWNQRLQPLVKGN